MIKLIQRIYRIYSNPHTGFCKCSLYCCKIGLMEVKGVTLFLLYLQVWRAFVHDTCMVGADELAIDTFTSIAVNGVAIDFSVAIHYPILP